MSSYSICNENPGFYYDEALGVNIIELGGPSSSRGGRENREPYYDTARGVNIVESRGPSSSRGGRETRDTSSEGRGYAETTTSSASLPTFNHRLATADDARYWNISKKLIRTNWNPDEEPIVLVGSVFDSSNLGLWIYDLAVFAFGGNSPLVKYAGALWLSLIKIGCMLGRSRKCVKRIQEGSKRDMVVEFIHTGGKLMKEITDILGICAKSMLKSQKKQGGTSALGERDGVEFVKAIFGTDKHLKDTEAFIKRAQRWILKFSNEGETIVAPYCKKLDQPVRDASHDPPQTSAPPGPSSMASRVYNMGNLNANNSTHVHYTYADVRNAQYRGRVPFGA